MVVVHVGEEHRAELLRSYAKLGQPHCRAAPRVELQLHGRTAIGVIPITHQGSGTGETIERLWAALRARQGHDKAWRCVCGCGCCKPGGGKQCDKRHPHGRKRRLEMSAFAPLVDSDLRRRFMNTSLRPKNQAFCAAAARRWKADTA